MTFPKYPEYKDSGVEWLGEVPAHWEVVKLKRLCHMQSGDFISPSDIKEDGEYPVYGGNGRRGFTSGYTHNGLYPLVGRQGALCGNVNYAQGRFWASEHAVVASPDGEVSPVWLGELLRAMDLNQYSITAAQPGLAVEKIKNLFTPKPPLGEQRAIASFLDHETGRIDALVEEQQRLIELLKEKRQAVISHAVTKGLDSDVPMKDSGVEWLEGLPENWEISPFRRGIDFLTDYEANGSFANTKEMVSLDAGEPYAWFVRATDLENNRIGLVEGNRFCDKASYDFLEKTKVFGHELLVSKRGEIGKVYVLPELSCKATIAPNLYLIRLNENLSSRFAYYWLSSSIGNPHLRLADKSTTIGALYKDDVKAIPFVFPLRDEQERVVAYLDSKLQFFYKMIHEATAALRLLQERRSALISAAVTGKIDVRGWQAGQHAEQAEVLLAAEERAAYVYGKEPSDEV